MRRKGGSVSSRLRGPSRNNRTTKGKCVAKVRFGPQADVSRPSASVGKCCPERPRSQRRSTRFGLLQRALENGRQPFECFAFGAGLRKRLGDHGLGLQRNASRSELKSAKSYPLVDLLVLDHVDDVDQGVE